MDNQTTTGTQTTINIVKNFSKYPAGRFRSDGDYSGTRFRDDILTPALQRFNIVTIEMDGTLGYGSSFLEEAFGGLIRVRGFNAGDLKGRLDIKTSDDNLVYTIRHYIDEAQSSSNLIGVAKSSERVPI